MNRCRTLGELQRRGRGCVLIKRRINCTESGSPRLGSSATHGQIEAASFAHDLAVAAGDGVGIVALLRYQSIILNQNIAGSRFPALPSLSCADIDHMLC
jgi:hypothetical protein